MQNDERLPNYPSSDNALIASLFKHSNLLQTRADLNNTRSYKQAWSYKEAHAREYLHVQISPVVTLNESTGNRVSDQGGKADTEEIRSVADTNLTNVWDLAYDCRHHGHKCSRCETDESCKDEKLRVCLWWDPESEHENSGENVHDDHAVETSNTVGHPAGDDTAKSAVLTY